MFFRPGFVPKVYSLSPPEYYLYLFLGERRLLFVSLYFWFLQIDLVCISTCLKNTRV